jgi:hypothetical protein
MEFLRPNESYLAQMLTKLGARNFGIQSSAVDAASTADGQLSDRSINTMDLKNRLRDIETDCRNCFHV